VLRASVVCDDRSFQYENTTMWLFAPVITPAQRETGRRGLPGLTPRISQLSRLFRDFLGRRSPTQEVAKQTNQARPLGAPPSRVIGGPIVRVVAQRDDRDCTAACIAMVADVEYEVALAALRKVGGRTRDKSYRLCCVERAAALLGSQLRRVRRGAYNPHLAAGVVCVRAWGRVHVAVLWHGFVFDTDGRVWLLDDYLLHWGPDGRLWTLLEVVDNTRR
jgi:hypothetical protein